MSNPKEQSPEDAAVAAICLKIARRHPGDPPFGLLREIVNVVEDARLGLLNEAATDAGFDGDFAEAVKTGLHGDCDVVGMLYNLAELEYNASLSQQ